MKFEHWLIVLIVVLIGLLVLIVISEAEEYQKEKICTKASYSDVDYWAGEYFCIGYDNEGNLKIIEYQKAQMIVAERGN